MTINFPKAQGKLKMKSSRGTCVVTGSHLCIQDEKKKEKHVYMHVFLCIATLSQFHEGCQSIIALYFPPDGWHKTRGCVVRA